MGGHRIEPCAVHLQEEKKQQSAYFQHFGVIAITDREKKLGEATLEGRVGRIIADFRGKCNLKRSLEVDLHLLRVIYSEQR